MTATWKAVVSTPCCPRDLWPLHCQLGKVESEKVPSRCLRVPTTKLSSLNTSVAEILEVEKGGF